jgi:hypothetical protein
MSWWPMIAWSLGADTAPDRPRMEANEWRPYAYMVLGLIPVDSKAAKIALSTDVGPRNRPSRARDTAPFGMIRNGGGQTRST